MDEAGKQVNAEMSSEGRTAVTVTATLRLWQARYEYLLDAAKRLRDEGHNEAAIVMAQAAGEACVELVLTKALRARVSDEAVAKFITSSLRSYNPSSDNRGVKKLYKLLFGKQLRQKEPFWGEFDKHVERRNDIVHHGYLATRLQSDESIATVEKVIDHLLPSRS